MSSQNKKILVIDNDPASTRMVRLMLERIPSFEVRELNNPLAAVRTAREFGPDLVLLDVEMPAMDGGEVAQGLQAEKRFADLPIIFMTSLVSDDETTHRALFTNGLRVLAKPVTMAKLVRCVAERLNVLCSDTRTGGGTPVPIR